MYLLAKWQQYVTLQYMVFGLGAALLVVSFVLGWVVCRNRRCGERHLRQANEAKIVQEELRQRNEELLRFAYTVSHDLKSPLVTIRTFLGYLEEDIQTVDTVAIAQDMKYMRQATDKMGLLLEDLLKIARVGTKFHPPKEEDFQEMLQETLESLAGILQGNGLQLQQMMPEQKMMVLCERARMQQVLQNLLENAVKFSRHVETPIIEVGAKSEGEGALVWVKDNGMGIEPPYLGKIFGLFEKLDPDSEGTGLGLALVEKIVQSWGGRIWAESEGKNKGTTLFISLYKVRWV